MVGVAGRISEGWENLYLAAFIAATATLCPELEEFLAEGIDTL